MIDVLITYRELLEEIIVNPNNGKGIKIQINGQKADLICIDSREKVGHFNKGVIEFIDSNSSTDSQVKTIDFFGGEWKDYDNWGWIDELPNEKHASYSYSGGLRINSKSALYSKTRTKPSDFENKIVLEGGCGNGRHTQFAKENAKLIVSIDPSDAIYVAAKNLNHARNVVFIKANLVNLPFAENSFDLIYSIGVLQHTGNPEQVLKEVNRCLKSNGVFGLNCYGKGYLPYEILDKTIRRFTANWEKPKQVRFSEKMANFSIFLSRNKLHPLYKLILFFININTSKCIMFDWYSPAIADHYSRKQLKKWFLKYNYQVVDSNIEINRPSFKYIRDKLYHGAFNIKLKKI